LGRIEELIARSDIVKASDDDIVWLYPGVTRDEVIVHWQSLGPSLVIITQGGDGVTAATGRHRIVLAAAPTTIVDTIGAGDSFMAGLLSALAERHALGSGAGSGAGNGAGNGNGNGNGAGTALAQMSKKDLSEVIGFALECAAITVSRAGANPPTRIELGSER
jgi:fructokinase